MIERFVWVVKKYMDMMGLYEKDVSEDIVKFDSLVGWMLFCYLEDGYFLDNLEDLNSYEWKDVGSVIELFGLEMKYNGFVREK